MNEELSYAEMLEIPVETVTVKKKEKRRRAQSDDLGDRLVEQVNDRMETSDPAYAESRTIERQAKPRADKKYRRIIVGEFIAVCALCAVIFLTNLFLADSAINTFVRGLFRGNASTADTRTHADFQLSPVVNEYVDADVAVSSTGVVTFTAACSVYAPCAGTVKSVTGNAETGYSMEIKHSDTFSTLMSGLDEVYVTVGETVRTNIPIARTDGEGAVRVMFYEGDVLLSNVSAENGLSWS